MESCFLSLARFKGMEAAILIHDQRFLVIMR